MVLTVEHGAKLGFLKLLYSSDPKYSGILQGVKSRSTSNQSPVTSVLLSDDRVLDQDEYELIVLGELYMTVKSARNVKNSNYGNNMNNRNALKKFKILYLLKKLKKQRKKNFRCKFFIKISMQS